MYILKYFAALMSGYVKKNRNYENDNDKLQCFTKTFNSQKYKKKILPENTPCCYT